MAKAIFKREVDQVDAKALVITDVEAGVNGNGSFHLFTSDKVVVNAGDNAIEVVVKYKENSPNPANGELAKYRLSCVLETQDEDLEWHPIHAQFSTFVNPEDGDTFVLRLDPKAFVIDTGVSNDISDGTNIIARESVKQGKLPDDFRLCVLVSEFGYDTNGKGVGSFNEVKLSATYNTFSV